MYGGLKGLESSNNCRGLVTSEINCFVERLEQLSIEHILICHTRFKTSMEQSFPFVIGGQYTPHVALKVFSAADKETLLKCRTVSKVWRDFVDNKTDLWGQMPPDNYVEAVRQGKLDICQLVINSTAKAKNPDIRGLTPLHHAALKGHFDICKMIIENTDDKNPRDNNGSTPLHWAAREGHADICRLIIDSAEDTNPVDDYGKTPLHLAVTKGHFDVCQMIMENTDDKNPADSFSGRTPLHQAAFDGNLEICRLILTNVIDKNPAEFHSPHRTPLDLALLKGHQDVARLWQD